MLTAWRLEREREADTFSIFMVLFGLRWFVEAVHDVCSSFKFPTVVVQAKSSLGRLHRELEMMTKHLDSGEFPETWTTDIRHPLKHVRVRRP